MHSAVPAIIGIKWAVKILNIPAQMPYTCSLIVLSVFGKFFVNSTTPHISLSHTVHYKKIWGMVLVKDM